MCSSTIRWISIIKLPSKSYFDTGPTCTGSRVTPDKSLKWRVRNGKWRDLIPKLVRSRKNTEEQKQQGKQIKPWRRKVSAVKCRRVLPPELSVCARHQLEDEAHFRVPGSLSYPRGHRRTQRSPFLDGDSPVCIYTIKSSAVLGLRKVMGSLSLEILNLSDIDLLWWALDQRPMEFPSRLS